MVGEKDRIGQYLLPLVDNYVFDELSDGYLEKAGVRDIMSGVPVPIKKGDMSGGITVLKLALGMAFIIGCDPGFKYRDNYMGYILHYFDKKFSDGLVSLGMEGAEKHDYDYACVQFRAAIQIDPDNAKAYYCYGRACKDAYERGEEEDFIGSFKAEALEAFEIATLKDENLADAYFYLGYAYVNMGLYVKAKLTWEKYVQLMDEEIERAELTKGDGKALYSPEELKTLRSEIIGRLAQLSEPVKIEEGYNLILTGKYEEGIEVLTPYKESSFKTWWPLWYYLGVAHESLAVYEEAKAAYLQVLKLSPSNEDTMERLAKVCGLLGEEALKDKYLKKLEVVRLNREEDRRQREEEGDPAGTPEPDFDKKFIS